MKEVNILGYTFGKKEKLTWEQKAQKAVQSFKQEPKASYNGYEYPIYEEIYDGEKSMGELGAPIHYIPSYSTLAARSWQAFTESDIAQIIIKAHVNWVIGSGLKLQAEPIEGVIDKEGFNFDKADFVKTTEERFRLYAKTKESVHSKRYDYNHSQRVTYLNAIVSGDILSVDMVENGLPTKRLIDGRSIDTPDQEQVEAAKERGNEIIHGVEIAPNDEHIAFHVKSKKDNGQFEFVRIPARGESTGRLQAYLVYGSEYRVDSVRGMPLLHAVLEKIKKIDRYNEAVVASAEEAAKVALVWKHNINAEGINPDLKASAQAITGVSTSDINRDMILETRQIKRTFNKEAINTPPGTELVRLSGGMESSQEAFTTGNFIFICAAVEIPYEVALMKYVNSFSSSRMASQSWAKILEMKRTEFNSQYNKNFYSTFLETQILTDKIKADGYLTAISNKDVILIEAYRNCRFTGIAVPQADPSKEVKAEISKIEAKLTSREEAMEKLGGTDDFATVVDKLRGERELIEENLPEPEPDEQNTQNN